MGILDPGVNLMLRPMKYPVFFEMYKAAIKNTWTVEEVDFSKDIEDINIRLTPSEQHVINRLIAFFATGDNIVQENVVLSLFKHINVPEAKLYIGRQIFEEALHVEFYSLLLDNYLPDMKEREEAFRAIENIRSISKKADFSIKWMGPMNDIKEIHTDEDRRTFLKNMIAFAFCNEGLFFFGAFAYVYFLRSKGLLNGLATGTNWVFRDESLHITFAYEVIKNIITEYPHIFDEDLKRDVVEMIREAVDCEVAFAEDVLSNGVAGLSLRDMREYIQHVADQRLGMLKIPSIYGSRNPFVFMELQDIQELTNFFERNVSAYQIAIRGEVKFNEEF